VDIVPTITTATTDRAPALAAVLARTFADDVMVSWPFHDHDVEERAVPLFAALLREYAALGIVIEAEGGAGVAAWIPPGSDVGLEQVNVVTWPEVVGLTDDGGDRYHRFWGWLESFVPSEPHWMLDMVGVDPTRQGEGIGSALVRYGVERAAADGVPAFLETSKPRNVPYYERFDFRVAHEEDAPGGGPHIWFMRFDP
jgi:ribosomal protein S18 acetylase RimI-like enzyme